MLYESNKTIMRWMADGFILKRDDRSQKDIHIELIDYNGVSPQQKSKHLDSILAESKVAYGKDNNIYKFVNQLEIAGTEKRIPDGIIYINGLPIVVFEFKSAIREEATINDAYIQLTTRYKRDIPELFKYNAFCVISDGVNNKAGSFFAPYEFYKNVAELRPEWTDVKVAEDGAVLTDKEKRKIKPMERIKIIMTRGKNDPKEMYDLLGTKEYRKELDRQFKNEKSNFKYRAPY